MIKVGLCGWTIGQREYFERYRVLEVQQTFYDPPAERTLLRWRESAPAGFEFTLKAWQLITHESTSSTYRRLRRAVDLTDVGAFRDSAAVRSAWQVTLRCAKMLRATAVLFQCPASFRPTDENLARMHRFFTTTERAGLRFLWEPRGPSWPAPIVRELCETLNLVHVVDPFVNERVTEAIYYRLHGVTGSRHVHTDAELQRVADLVRDAEDAYVMFNNLPRVGDAERFVRMAGNAR